MADNEELLITLGVQDKGTNKQINAITKEIKALDKEFKSASSVSKDFGNSIEGMRTKLTYLERSYTANNTKLESYRRKMQEARDAIASKETELNSLNSAENVNERAVAKATEQLERMRSTLRQTEQNISLTENELQRLTNEINTTNNALQNNALNQYRQHMQEVGQSVQNTGERISKVGQVFSATGASLMTLSAPMVAFAGYASKVAMDFEASMSNVQAISGATGNDLQVLSEKAKEMGAKTSKSAKESADAMGYMALAGWNTQQMLEGIEPILRLSEAGNADLATTSDLVTDSMSSMGVQTQDLSRYLDIVAKTQNSANTSANAMLEAYIPVGGQFKSLNTSMEESATLLGVLANRGIKGAEAGNSLNSILINLTKKGGESAEAMKDLGISAFDSEGKFIGIEQTLKLVSDATKDLTEEQRTNYLNMIGGKTQINTLNALLSGLNEEYGTLKGKITDSDGALNKMAETMQNNAKGNITRLKSQLEGLGIQVGEKLIPHINDLVQEVSDLITWFGNLDEGTQQAIVKFGLMTFATGGLLTVVGKVTTGIGGLVTGGGKLISWLGGSATATGSLTSGLGALSAVALPLTGVIAGVAGGIYLYTKNQDAMNKSVITSSEEMGTLETALVELNGVHVKSKKELEDLGLVYKDFNENISDQFKNKVEESTDAINDFNFYLGQINMDGVITEEESSGFTTRINTMVDSAISAIQGKQATVQTELSKMFTLGDGVVDESEQQVLNYLNKNYTTNITEITKLKEEINAIYKKGIEERGQLNEVEIKQIQERNARIKQIELEALANNEEEQLFAKNEFINRIKQVDADGAKELLVEQKKTLDEQNAQTLAAYDTQIETMKIAREKAEGAERENLDKQIQLKTEERDKIIEKQRETWQGCIDVVEEMNPNLVGTINKYNGEILSNEDIHAQNMLELFKSSTNGLEDVTESGWYNIQDKITGAVQNCYIEVDKSTGEIVGSWNNCTQKSGGYTDALDEKVREVGKAHSEEQDKISSALITLSGAWGDASGQIVGKGGEIIGTMHDVTTATDGTKKGIIDINGTPMEIKTNSSGVITEIGGVKQAIDGIPRDVYINMRTTFSKEAIEYGVADGARFIDHNDVGTYNYSGGISTIDEKDWELASNNNVSLANIPSGTAIRTHMQSVSDMKNEVRKQINSLLATKNTNSNAIDYDKLATVMLTTLSQGLSNANTNVNVQVDVDANGMVTKAVSKTMDTLKRNTKNNNVSKGR